MPETHGKDVMSLTPRAIELLRALVKAEDAGDDEGAEVVRDVGKVWHDVERIGSQTLDQLLQVVALSDVSDESGMERYRANNVGREIARDPALADAIAQALITGQGPFTIKNGLVVAI